MKKKRLKKILLCLLVLCWWFNIPAMKVSAATNVNYWYSGGVSTGTVRYISQVPGSTHWNANYWGNYSYMASGQCGIASVSMALSYIGINKTPKNLLDETGGIAKIAVNYGGSKCSRPDIATGMNNFLSGNGRYSPLVICIRDFSPSSSQHFVIVMDKLSSNQYKVVDPWEPSSFTKLTLNGGNQITYTTNKGGTRVRTVDVYQYYTGNPNPSPGIRSDISISPTIAKTSMNIGETCIVGGTISSSGSPISSVTAGVYTDANGTTCVNGIQASRTVNRYSYNISNIDAAVHFQKITSGGTYYFVVKATLANGTTKTASRQFAVRGAQCGEPTINTMDVSGGKQLAISVGSADTVHYIVKKDGVIVDNGSCAREFKKAYAGTGKYSVTAYASRNGYLNSNSKSIDFNIEQVALPKIVQTALENHMAVNILSDTPGAVIYYTTSGNTPSVNSNRYNGTLTLNEQKTIKAIAVKAGMADSNVSENVIKMQEPEAPTGLTLVGEDVIPMGETISVKWNSSQLASGYKAILYQNGKKVKEVSTLGTSTSFVLEEAGEYTVNVYATNFVGNSTESEKAVKVKAMSPSTVSFKNWDGSIIKSQEVPYGHDATIPPDPERRGYTFLHWDNEDKVKNVKGNLDVTAVYKINTYTVRFYNKTGNQVGATQKVNYMESAKSPEAELTDIPTGYIFAGWKVIQASNDSAGDYKAVDCDMKLQAVYYWHNNELPIVTEILYARQNVKTGNYNVSVKLTNYPENTTTAILRVSLMTKDGKMVKTTKTEVEVDKDGTTTKTVTMKYSGVATKASAVILGMSGDDQTSSAYSKEVVANVTVQSNEVWSEWSKWSTKKPEGFSGDALETITQYRYADKTTTTSSSANMDGWTLYDKKNSWNNWGNWSGWSEAYQGGSDSKQVESRTEYRYYAFVCPVCGGREPFTGRSDCHRYTLTGANAQVIWSPVAYKDCNPAGYSYTTAKLHTTSLGDGKNWNFSAGNRYHTSPGTKDAAGPDAVVIRTVYRYRTRSQNTTYYYYKWNEWSDWEEKVYSETDNRKVESRVLYRTREKVPVYSPLAGKEEATGNVYHIKGNIAGIKSDLKGKLATIMVYKGKNTDPNEDQIQYVGQTVLGKDNTYEFDVIPKTDPTAITGDFTVALGIQGSTGLINIDVIKYKKSIYQVKYLDDDGTMISSQEVEEGANAKVPVSPKKVGNYFIGWSENAINVQSNMNINAMYVPVEYVVTYVDSSNGIVSFNTHHYGDKLIPPENPTAEGKEFVGWDSIISGNTTVKENMVVNAVYKAKTYTVKFVDEKGNVINTQKVEYGKAAILPSALDVSDKEFIGWSTENEWWHVTENMTVKPLLAEMKSVETPYYYTVPSGDCVAVYFETATKDASIYYTLDGKNPDKKSNLYDGNAVILDDFDIKEEIDKAKEQITFHRTANINTIAIKEGMNDSEVQKIIYTDTITVPLNKTEATVTFEVNGAKELDETTKIVKIGEEFGELPVPSYKGYDFEGWYTGAEDGAKVEAEDICNNDIVLFAHWTKNSAVHEHTIVIDSAIEATCKQEGKTEGRHCSECNEVIVAQKAIPKTNHKWNSGVVTKEATCAQEGKRIYTCEFCGITKVETIEKTEHKPENIEGIPSVKATCEKNGKTAGSYCTVCGEIITPQKLIPARGHLYGEWKEVKKATCKEEGAKERICENCGEKESQTTAKVAHTRETRNETEATCKLEGYTGDIYCKVCGEYLEAGKTIEKKEHTWNGGKILVKSTCNKSGSICYTCRECGETKNEKMPLGEHEGGKATCTQKAVCSSCGKEYGKLDPNNHVGQTEIRNRKNATLTEEGYTGDIYCLDCNNKIKSGKKIPVLPTEKDAIIRVQDRKASPGTEVTIPVTIEKNSGIAGFSFDVIYDKDILTLKSVKSGEVLSDGQISTNGDVINWYTTDNVVGNGEILNMTFLVKESSENGETEISITPHNGKKNLVDENGSYVDANYQSGTLQIKKGLIGDINTDDELTIADVVVLNRSVLGKHTIPDSIFALADINDDGEITIGDVVILNRHILGKENLMDAREYLISLGNYLGAGGSATISVDDVTVKAGDTFDVPVWIEENTGLAGIALKFEIPKGFTLNSITSRNLLSKGSFVTDGNTCTWYAPTNMKSDGELMVLNLTADKNVESGKILVDVKDEAGNNFTDEHGASMLVNFSAGTIKVMSECEKNGHKADKPVRENEKVATCDMDGSYDEVVYCKICHEEIARESKIVPGGHQWDSTYKVDKVATCTEEGTEAIHCKVCGEVKEGSSRTISKINHHFGEWKIIKQATTSEAGIKERVCSVCNEIQTMEIPKIVSKPSINVVLSKTVFVYNGKVQKPRITVKYGNKILTSAAYTIIWPKGCKSVGRYSITIRLRGGYSGTKITSYTINPKGTRLIKAVSGKAKQKLINVSWKKQATQATGYQIQYGLKSNFQGAKIFTVSNNRKTNATIKKLIRGKLYYVRIRTYRKIGKTLYLSSWSLVKKVRIK